MAASEPAWEIGRLSRRHQREGFDCGVAPLDEFLRRFARQNDARGLGRTYVAVRAGEPRVRGYYTLASGAVAFASLAEKEARRLPRYPVPVVLLARLAVDRSEQGKGLGETLLMHALANVVRAAEVVGIRAVEVVAKEARARRFYERFGFGSLRDDELHMYLSIDAIQRAFEA